MHTFSPAKSWILGLQEYRKPLLHLHTQFNEEIPYDTIDMDFMNENQSAHGDREYGHIVSRMGIVDVYKRQAQNHSRPYQYWLIWGLPVIGTMLFFWCVKREGAKKADAFGVLLGISALGLIVIPEIVYVRDIYEKEYARSNTMFKLTYQAFTCLLYTSRCV